MRNPNLIPSLMCLTAGIIGITSATLRQLNILAEGQGTPLNTVAGLLLIAGCVLFLVQSRRGR